MVCEKVTGELVSLKTMAKAELRDLNSEADLPKEFIETIIIEKMDYYNYFKRKLRKGQESNSVFQNLYIKIGYVYSTCYQFHNWD